MRLHERIRVRHFIREGRRGQNLRYQGIRIECDRRNQLIKLVWCQRVVRLRRSLLRRSLSVRLIRRWRRWCFLGKHIRHAQRNHQVNQAPGQYPATNSERCLCDLFSARRATPPRNSGTSGI